MRALQQMPGLSRLTSDLESQSDMTHETASEDLQTVVRNANIFLRRGDYASARSACESGMQQYPESAELLELLGDILSAEGKRQEAAEAYQHAMKLDPSLAQAEIKYARIVLNLSEENRQREALAEAFANLGAVKVEKRSPLMAFLASLLWPGLGQWYNGENTKAIVLASAAGVSVLGLLITGDLSRMLSMFLAAIVPVAAVAARAQPPGILSMLLWGGGAIAWVYAVIDAPVRANSKSQDKQGL